MSAAPSRSDEELKLPQPRAKQATEDKSTIRTGAKFVRIAPACQPREAAARLGLGSLEVAARK
jgi:hypothetical protein